MWIDRLDSCDSCSILSCKKGLVHEQLDNFVRNPTILISLYEIRTFSHKCPYRYTTEAVILRGIGGETSKQNRTVRLFDPTIPKNTASDYVKKMSHEKGSSWLNQHYPRPSEKAVLSRWEIIWRKISPDNNSSSIVTVASGSLTMPFLIQSSKTPDIPWA